MLSAFRANPSIPRTTQIIYPYMLLLLAFPAHVQLVYVAGFVWVLGRSLYTKKMLENATLASMLC